MRTLTSFVHLPLDDLRIGLGRTLLAGNDGVGLCAVAVRGNVVGANVEDGARVHVAGLALVERDEVGPVGVGVLAQVGGIVLRGRVGGDNGALVGNSLFVDPLRHRRTRRVALEDGCGAVGVGVGRKHRGAASLLRISTNQSLVAIGRNADLESASGGSIFGGNRVISVEPSALG